MEARFVDIVANIISTATILTCLYMKVPQIMYIRQKQSAEGLYIQAMLMEIIGFSVVTLYNFTNRYSMMTYLEYPIILLQVYVMLFYALKYKKLLNSPRIPLAIVLYVVFVMMFLWNILPQRYLSYMVPFCTPLSGFAKVTYMYGIIKTANADAVSLTTWIISVLTNVSRLFTVYVDSADAKLMINFVISAILSSGVLGTAIYYQRKSVACVKQRRRKSSCKHHPKENQHCTRDCAHDSSHDHHHDSRPRKQHDD